MGGVHSAVVEKISELKRNGKRSDDTKRSRSARLRETLLHGSRGKENNGARLNWQRIAIEQHKCRYGPELEQKLHDVLLNAMESFHDSPGLHQLMTSLDKLPAETRQRVLSMTQEELLGLPPIPTLPFSLNGGFLTAVIIPGRDRRNSDDWRCHPEDFKNAPVSPRRYDPLPGNVKALILSFAFYAETAEHICAKYHSLACRHRSFFETDYHGVQVADADDPDANGWYQRLESTVARPRVGPYADDPDAWRRFIQERPIFRKHDGYYIRYSANQVGSGSPESNSSNASSGSYWSLIDPEGYSLCRVRSRRKMPPELGWRIEHDRESYHSHMSVNIVMRRHRGNKRSTYASESEAKSAECNYAASKLEPPAKPHPDEIEPWNGYFQLEDDVTAEFEAKPARPETRPRGIVVLHRRSRRYQPVLS